MKKQKKYDLIIYGCLLAAIICLVLGGKDYFIYLYKEKTSPETEPSIKEINNEDEFIIQEEPDTLKEYNKSTIIISYLDSILDRITNDKLISYDMINTWGGYEVLNVVYNKTITNNYFEYQVDIKINNKEASLPTNINEELSTEEYNVITLKFYINDYINKREYIVKMVTI